MAEYVTEYYRYGNIDAKTWWLQDICGNYCYLLEGKERAALIDSGIGLPGLRECVETLTKRTVIVLLTHGHLDHIGGMGWWDNVCIHKEDAHVLKLHQSAGYRSLIEQLMEEIGIKIPKDVLRACITIKKAEKLSFLQEEIIALGGRELRVVHSPGHTKGSICLLEKKRKYLFCGDTICEKRVMLSFPESQSPRVYANSIKGLIKEAGETVQLYPGHNKIPLSGRWMHQYCSMAEKIEEGILIENKQAEHSVFGTCRVFCCKDTELTCR